MGIKRKKPLPRSRRKDYTGDFRFAGINPSRDRRDQQITRRDDTVKNVSITLEDIDGAIKYYFDNILKPQVMENGRKIDVPTMFGSPERWKAIENDGYFRDEKGKIILPLIMYKRTNITKDDNIPVDKIDRNIVYTFQKQYSSRNRYDKFSVLTNKIPTKERYKVIIPDYVILTYECVAWTSYVSQMNKIEEKLQFSSEDYWGDDSRFKFHTTIENMDQAIEFGTDTERGIRTNFTLTVKGYLIPEFYNELMNTQKFYTTQQIKLDIDADASFMTDEVKKKAAVADKDSVKQLGPDVSDIVELLQLTLGDVKDECFSYLRKVKTYSTILPPDPDYSASITEPTFEGRQFVKFDDVATASLSDCSCYDIGDDEFFVFVNGLHMEHDAYAASQSGSQFIIEVDTGSLGFELESDDEIVLWGKFETDPGPLNVLETSLYSLKQKYVSYFRKQSVQFADNASTVYDNGNGESVITFSSVATASAPTDLVATNKDDFLIFVNGQYMEHDAISIQQSGSDFVVVVSTGSLGFAIDTDDEVVAWGRFEETFDVEFSKANMSICRFPKTYCSYLGLANSYSTLTCDDYTYTASIVEDNGNGQSVVTYTDVYTQSAPFDVQPTDKDDFLLFINGQYAEHDAFEIEQSGSAFIVTISTGSLGYSVEGDDEVIMWGKFENKTLFEEGEDVFLVDINGDFFIDIEDQYIVVDGNVHDCPPLI